MKLYWHKKKKENDRLILIFNGWGFDERIIRGIDSSTYDLLLVYDYATPGNELEEYTRPYREIVVVAWSYGVFMANRYCNDRHNIVKRIAINGTLYPIHDEYGIPERIFRATLLNFSEQSREKFYLRVFGGAAAYKDVKEKLPVRSVEDQRNELIYLAELFQCDTDIKSAWDLALISDSDKIVPFRHMKAAWGDVGQVVKGEHYIDFDMVIRQYII
jgi:Uncharacterized protein conserved in bacteria